jgi:hypothetical protein
MSEAATGAASAERLPSPPSPDWDPATVPLALVPRRSTNASEYVEVEEPGLPRTWSSLAKL